MATLATDNLRDLLSELEDTHELVLHAGDDDPFVSAWRAAAVESHTAYATWCAEPGALRHAAYVAAEERADAALAALVLERPDVVGERFGHEVVAEADALAAGPVEQDDGYGMLVCGLVAW